MRSHVADENETTDCVIDMSELTPLQNAQNNIEHYGNTYFPIENLSPEIIYNIATQLPYGYELCLMSDTTTPEKGKVYLRLLDENIAYTVITPGGRTIRDRNIDDISAPQPFTLEKLNELKDEILLVTSNAWHTDVNFHKENLFPLRSVSKKMTFIIENTCAGILARQAYTLESSANMKSYIFGGLAVSACFLGFLGGAAGGMSILYSRGVDWVGMLCASIFVVPVGGSIGMHAVMYPLVIGTSMAKCAENAKFKCQIYGISELNFIKRDFDEAKIIRESLKHPILFFSAEKKIVSEEVKYLLLENDKGFSIN